MTQGFTLAVAQSPADLDGPAARQDWLRRQLPHIVTGGAELVVLPELFDCGYNIKDAMTARAEPADGAALAAYTDMARAHNVAICFGFAEREGTHIYNAAICISAQGKVLGHHRKLAIPPGFEQSVFSAGQGCAVFDFKGMKTAILICYDAEFPETARHVAALGAEVVLVPTALGNNWSWVAHRLIPTRAYENGVYLAYANSAGTQNGMAFLGESVIAAPDGQEAARAGNTPTVIFAKLDKTRVINAQKRLPYLNDRLRLRLD